MKSQFILIKLDNSMREPSVGEGIQFQDREKILHYLLKLIRSNYDHAAMRGLDLWYILELADDDGIKIQKASAWLFTYIFDYFES